MDIIFDNFSSIHKVLKTPELIALIFNQLIQEEDPTPYFLRFVDTYFNNALILLGLSRFNLITFEWTVKKYPELILQNKIKWNNEMELTQMAIKYNNLTIINQESLHFSFFYYCLYYERPNLLTEHNKNTEFLNWVNESVLKMKQYTDLKKCTIFYIIALRGSLECFKIIWDSYYKSDKYYQDIKVIDNKIYPRDNNWIWNEQDLKYIEIYGRTDMIDMIKNFYFIDINETPNFSYEFIFTCPMDDWTEDREKRIIKMFEKYNQFTEEEIINSNMLEFALGRGCGTCYNQCKFICQYCYNKGMRVHSDDYFENLLYSITCLCHSEKHLNINKLINTQDKMIDDIKFAMTLGIQPIFERINNILDYTSSEKLRDFLKSLIN